MCLRGWHEEPHFTEKQTATQRTSVICPKSKSKNRRVRDGTPSLCNSKIEASVDDIKVFKDGPTLTEVVVSWTARRRNHRPL